MKNLLKALSFFLVLVSGFLTIFKLNERNNKLLAKEVTVLQVNQTIAAIAATLEKSIPIKQEAPQEASSLEKESSPRIKANRNARGEYIYHVPGGVFYDRTKPVEWFHTEEEAKAAGYRKSAR
ncbi:hypothetical protein FIU87_15130 [Bacillus sp. THAF10]|uniref:sunset domain-containing protein n=1 Tax=Bacillus sp. THAF10 TaxID=2587848 RepID=UPI001268847C|nr:hypothetical protein [Bacillus sp. THAF10]QFT89997.1 hypothetical protein FIU87_15130 [Bacillus sp. THAF10]